MYMFYSFFRPEMKRYGAICHTDDNLNFDAFGISVSHATAVLRHLERQKTRVHFLDRDGSIAQDCCALECLFCRFKFEGRETTIDPTMRDFFNPKVLNYFAKCDYQPARRLSAFPEHV